MAAANQPPGTGTAESRTTMSPRVAPDATAGDAQPDGAAAESAVRRPGSIAATFRAVAWSFFGVRRGAAHESDLARINPVHLVIVAIISAVLFVLALLMLVRLATG